ncbi:hypothetical protein TWF694_008423 [Orbilia ellipsospora]|uniref:Uncharacterized protein n=1 Tax=Orbilia ellipsospora TaxID=2528407 RepID=A0AAV9XG20_9PEZI
MSSLNSSISVSAEAQSRWSQFRQSFQHELDTYDPFKPRWPKNSAEDYYPEVLSPDGVPQSRETWESWGSFDKPHEDGDWKYELPQPVESEPEYHFLLNWPHRVDQNAPAPEYRHLPGAPWQYESDQSPQMSSTQSSTPPTSDDSPQATDEYLNLDEFEMDYEKYLNYDNDTSSIPSRTADSVLVMPPSEPSSAFDDFVFSELVLAPDPPIMPGPSTAKHGRDKKDDYSDGTEEIDTRVICSSTAKPSILASICEALPFDTFTPDYLSSLRSKDPGSDLVGMDLASFASYVWRDVLQHLESQPPAHVNQETLERMNECLSWLVIYDTVFGSNESNFVARKPRYLRLNYEDCSLKFDNGSFYQPGRVRTFNNTFDLFPGSSQFKVEGIFRRLYYWTSNWERVLENQFEINGSSRYKKVSSDSTGQTFEPWHLSYSICQRERVFPDVVEVTITVKVSEASILAASSRKEPTDRDFHLNEWCSIGEKGEHLKFTTVFYIPKEDVKPKENISLEKIDEEIEEYKKQDEDTIMEDNFS